MAYDRNRPIPWKQLAKFAGIYLVLANVVLYGVGRGKYNIATLATTVVGAIFYLAFSGVMAKFGLDPVSQRARRTEMQKARMAERAARPRGAPRSGRRKKEAAAVDGVRARPAPTSRTNASNRQPKKR